MTQSLAVVVINIFTIREHLIRDNYDNSLRLLLLALKSYRFDSLYIGNFLVFFASKYRVNSEIITPWFLKIFHLVPVEVPNSKKRLKSAPGAKFVLFKPKNSTASKSPTKRILRSLICKAEPS